MVYLSLNFIISLCEAVYIHLIIHFINFCMLFVNASLLKNYSNNKISNLQF